MRIEILGDGCVRCKALKAKVLQAVEELELDAEVDSEIDPKRLAEFGVMSLPGLVVDGEMHASAGKLSTEEIKTILGKD